MKIVLALMIAGALATAAEPLSGSWTHPLDARPEAVATGGALLVVASILRRGNGDRRTK